MLSYTFLCKRPICFRAFTSLTVEEFDRLVALIRSDWVIQRQERLAQSNPQRKRKEGGGRKQALKTLEDQLLLTLVWSRMYAVYLVLEIMFSIDESTVSRTIRVITLLLQDRFMLPKRLPRRKVRTLEELKKYLPKDIDLDDLLADATEQKILRPVSKRTRKPYHSGKKQAFTVKTQIATTRRAFIIHVSDTIGGRRHDYKLFQHSGLPRIIPKDTKLFADNGYQGAKKDYPDLQISLPVKRHRGHTELTRFEKIQNKKQRRVRIRVENAFAQLKKYRVLADIYRHSLQNYNQAFRFVANLVNFRMLQRQQAG